MIKVNILDKCEFCNGEAYVPVGEAESAAGERYTRYQPCAYCEGSGLYAKWVSLEKFIDLLTSTASQDPFEPDWLDLAKRRPTSQYQDSRDAAGV